jgi:hypothetical protein
MAVSIHLHTLVTLLLVRKYTHGTHWIIGVWMGHRVILDALQKTEIFFFCWELNIPPTVQPMA